MFPVRRTHTCLCNLLSKWLIVLLILKNPRPFISNSKYLFPPTNRNKSLGFQLSLLHAGRGFAASVLILAPGSLQAWLSVWLFQCTNDLTNVLGLLAHSPALSVPLTVVLILLSLVQPVAVDLHANTPPAVLPVPHCPAPSHGGTLESWTSRWQPR